jgi:hypothetical protein
MRPNPFTVKGTPCLSAPHMAHLSFYQNHHDNPLQGQGMSTYIYIYIYNLSLELMLSLGITTREYKACIKLNSQRRRSLGDINGKYSLPSENDKIVPLWSF